MIRNRVKMAKLEYTTVNWTFPTTNKMKIHPVIFSGTRATIPLVGATLGCALVFGVNM